MFRPKNNKKKPVVQDNSGPGQVVMTTQKIKETIDRLQKRRNFLEKKSQILGSEAKKLAKQGNKKGALLKLKHRKLYEKETLKLDSSILSMEQQMLSLESMSTNQEIITAMRAGVRQQQALNGRLNPDEVAELQDAIAQNMEDAEEVTNILGEDMFNVEDDEELLREFNDITIEDLESDLEKETTSVERTLDLPLPPKKQPVALPTAPKTKIPELDDDEAALRALETEML